MICYGLSNRGGLYMNFEFKEITTERLLLRKLEIKDSGPLFNFHKDKGNFLDADLPVYKAIEDVVLYIEKMNQGIIENKWYIWAIVSKDTSELMGSLTIWNLDKDLNKAEFGYALFPNFRGNGYMKEALLATIDYGFNILKLDSIEAYTKVDNQKSRRLLEALEFKYLETIEDDYSNGALMSIYKIDKN